MGVSTKKVILIAVVIIVILVGAYISVLAIADPSKNPLAESIPWPVACSTRGCITSSAWANQYQIARTFADSTNQETPAPADSLTTLVRQHLAHHATATSPITPADATRYRQEILNLSDEAEILSATGLSPEEYDTQIVLPFLEQESVRQQQSAESPSDLYQQLASERSLVVFSFSLKWDSATATVN